MRRLLAAAVIGLATAAGAADVTVAWTFATTNMDGTPLTDLAGAKVYYGTASSNYTHVIEVPGGTPGADAQFTVTGLVAGVTYFLNGTAYSTRGLESDFCNEVSKVAVDAQHQVPSPNDALRVLSQRRQIMVIRRNADGQYVPMTIWQTHNGTAWEDEI
jgi:hypothetical protein